MNDFLKPENSVKSTVSVVLGGIVLFSMATTVWKMTESNREHAAHYSDVQSFEENRYPESSEPDTAKIGDDSVHRMTSAKATIGDLPSGLPVAAVRKESNHAASNEESPAAMIQGRPPIVQVETRGGRLFGLPIARFADESWFMRNDAAIQRISQEELVSEKILPVPFEPIAAGRLVEELRKEFGANYSVRHESPYVFVTKSSHGLQWVARFRSLYQSMQVYCRTQGYVTRTLDFPLIAIVLGSEEEFIQYARTHDAEIPPHCVGFYSQRDNRIVMFEDAQRMSKQETLDTICHEAAHQLAFNMGLHQRCSGVPLWLAEGFATMFEAPALVSANAKGRSNWPGSRQVIWERVSNNPQSLHSAIESLIRNDNLFKQDPDLAYTVSWAMTQYLSNVHPKRFGEYVHETSQLPPFQSFHGPDRWAHFRKVFEMESGKLTHQLQRYMSSLR